MSKKKPFGSEPADAELDSFSFDEWADEFGAIPLEQSRRPAERAAKKRAKPQPDAQSVAPSAPGVRLRETAPEWLAALERIVLDSALQCSAAKALRRLEPRFPGLSQFYADSRAEFESLLRAPIRLIGEGSSACFYHETHPFFERVPAAEGAAALDIGSGARFQRSMSEPKRVAPTSTNVDVATRASQWNEMLVRLVCQHDMKYPALDALALLNDPFPGILNYFKNAPKAFARLLDDRLTLARDRDVDYFYHKSHTDLAPVDLDDVVDKLKFSGESISLKPVKKKEPKKGAPKLAAPPRRVDEPASSGAESAFAASASQWSSELEEYLHKHNLKSPVLNALEYLSKRFPNLDEFYLDRPKEFAELLGANVFLVRGDDGADYLYHRANPEMKAVSVKDAVKRLDIGSEAPVAELEYDADYFPTATRAATFGEVADRAELLGRQSQWSVNRLLILRGGGKYDELVKPEDAILTDLARSTGTCLWQHRPDLRLNPSEYKFTARCYELLAKSLRLLQRVSERRGMIGPSLFGRAIQLAFDAQCLVKSALTAYNVPSGGDQAQREAFELLTEFYGKNYGYSRLARTEPTAVLPLSAIDGLCEEYMRVSGDFSKYYARKDSRKSCEVKLTRAAARIKMEGEGAPIEVWNELVVATTDLCELFDEQPSSPTLREALADMIEQTPEALETTDAFGKVVQQIDLFNARESERLGREEPEHERVRSPELERVRSFLDGKTVVFIGGTPQDHLRKRIETELNVRLFWMETSHGHSLDRFDPNLRDPDVALFLAYIPWCSHKHSEELAAIVKGSGKELVRLRKGTNPEQIARAICQQVNLFP